MHVAQTLKILGIACLAVAAVSALHDVGWAYNLLQSTGVLPPQSTSILFGIPGHLLLLAAGYGLLRRRPWTPRVVVAYGLWQVGLSMFPPLIRVLPQFIDNYAVRGIGPFFDFGMVLSLVMSGLSALSVLAFPLLLMGFMTMRPVLVALRREDPDSQARLRVAPLFGGINLLEGFAGIGFALAIVAIALTNWLSPGAGPSVSGAVALPIFRNSAVIGLLYLVSGYGLLRGASWARPIAILAAVAAIGSSVLYALSAVVMALATLLGFSGAPLSFGGGATPAGYLFIALLGGLRTLIQAAYPALLLIFVLRAVCRDDHPLETRDAEVEAGPAS